MSGGNLNTELGPVPAVADDTRALAIAYITRTQPDAELLLDILGLGRPEVPDPNRRLDGSRADKTPRFCACGTRLKSSYEKCAYCRGARRTTSAPGGDA